MVGLLEPATTPSSKTHVKALKLEASVILQTDSPYHILVFVLSIVTVEVDKFKLKVVPVRVKDDKTGVLLVVVIYSQFPVQTAGIELIVNNSYDESAA